MHNMRRRCILCITIRSALPQAADPEVHIMNISPVKIILLLLLLSSDNRGSQPAYFDTFRLDLLLDKLHHTVNALENVNRLRQFNLDTLSLPESKPVPPQEPAPDMSKMMESFGPMLNMLINQK